MALIVQEVRPEREIEIPEPVRDVYRQWRPTPLFRARRLEQALIRRRGSTTSTRASARPAATSRTPRCAQAFYNKEAGIKKIATETGAGQWGSALAFAGALFGIEVQVFMVRVSYDQKPYRRALMETYGARCVASPSSETDSGRADPGRAPGQHRQPRHRDLRGGRGRRQARRHQVRARLGAQPRAAAPDGHRPGGDGAAGDGGRLSRHRHRLHRRRLELRRHRVPVPRRAAARRQEGRASIAVEPAACPTPDARQVRLRLRRHRPPDAAGQDAHARARRSCRPASTPAGCAITAWRRWCQPPQGARA